MARSYASYGSTESSIVVRPAFGRREASDYGRGLRSPGRASSRAARYWGWLLPLVNFSFARDLGPWLCGALLSLILVAAVPALWQLIPVSQSIAPIVIKNQVFDWTGPRTLRSTSEGATWTRTCPVVLMSRGVLLSDGGYVGLEAIIRSGPLAGIAHNPRWQLTDLTPQERPGSVIEYQLPSYVNIGEVVAYSLIQRTPVEQASVGCPAGRWESVRLLPHNPYAPGGEKNLR